MSDWGSSDEEAPEVDEEPSAAAIAVSMVNESRMEPKQEERVQLPPPTRPQTYAPPKPQSSTSHVKASTIPVLTKYTLNEDTYDLDRLIDPKIQRSVKQGHRFSTVQNYHRQSSWLEDGEDRQTNKYGVSAKCREIDRRFANAAKTREKMQSDLAETYKAKEESECTFQPHTRRRKRAVKSAKGSKSFYEKQEEYTARSKQLHKKLKEEHDAKRQEDEAHYFKPAINKGSKASADAPAHQRLFEQIRTPLNRQRELLQKRADGTPETTRQVATRDTCADLYADAQRRAAQPHQRPTSSSPPPKTVSAASEKLIAQRFRSDLKDVLSSYTRTTLRYEEFVQVLQALHFLAQNDFDSDRSYLALDIWEMIQEGNQRALVDSLRVVLLAVMGLQAKASTLTGADVDRLHSQFYPLCLQRMNAGKSNSKPTFHSLPDDPKFAPEISERTRKLAQKRSGHVSQSDHADRLISEKWDVKVKKSAALKAAREAEKGLLKPPKTNKGRSAALPTEADYKYRSELNAAYVASAEPSTDRFEALHNFAKLRNEHAEKRQNEGHAESIQSDLQPCTFKPDLTKPTLATIELPPPKGIDKFLARIILARRNAEEIAAMREKGHTYSEKRPPKSIDQRTLTSGSEVFEIEITLGDHTEMLRIDHSAPVEEIITRFASKNNLDQESAQRLIEEIRGQISNADV